MDNIDSTSSFEGDAFSSLSSKGKVSGEPTEPHPTYPAHPAEQTRKYPSFAPAVTADGIAELEEEIRRRRER